MSLVVSGTAAPSRPAASLANPSNSFKRREPSRSLAKPVLAMRGGAQAQLLVLNRLTEATGVKKRRPSSDTTAPMRSPRLGPFMHGMLPLGIVPIVP